MTQHLQQPIGIFDSGVGGLSVLKHLEILLPNEQFIYFADSAFFPYGNKTTDQLIERCFAISQFLISKGIKMLIIACHTASTNAYLYLKEKLPIPVIGMIEPTIETIKAKNLKGNIVILGTDATIRSGKYQDTGIQGLNSIPLACPDLIKKIENHERVLEEDIAKAFNPLKGLSFEAILLACTHYSHIAKEIAQALDSKVLIIDPSLSVAELALLKCGNRIFQENPNPHEFYVSGSLEKFQEFLYLYPLKNKSLNLINY